MSQQAKSNAIQPTNANIKPVDYIWVHKNPDIDEIIALLIAMNKGKYRFPGIENAQIVLVDPGQVKQDYFTLLDRKILCIGFGGGPFDEHPQDGDDGHRIEGQSAASLVATVLGCRYTAGYQELVEYTIKKDNGTADSHMFEIAVLAKQAFRYLPHREKDKDRRETKMYDILNAVFILLEGFIEQRNAKGDCAADFTESVNRFDLVKPNGKKFQIVSVVSSNPEMKAYCFGQEGDYAFTVIQRQKSGHTQIYFNYQQVDEDAVAAIILDLRKEERRANNYRGPFNLEELTADGAIPGAEAWYFERSKRLILNGSLTHSRPPTKLSRDHVEFIVDNALRNHFKRISQLREAAKLAKQQTAPKGAAPSQTQTPAEV